jgi:hypothetical protein
VARYAALSLTGCAGVAVLGARRPGVGAWNFVVVGLLAVLLRPLWEGLGDLHLGEAHLAFLAATVAVPLVNYLPTRLGPAAAALAAGAVIEALPLARVAVPGTAAAGRALVALAPWLAWAGVCRHRGATDFDRLWRAYRDRFGLVWGQRMREQFNHAARNAGWPVVLGWGGLRATGPGAPPPSAALATLRAVLKRFGPQGEDTPPAG